MNKFQYLMKEADNNLEKFKLISNSSFNVINSISNNLNSFVEQVLRIPTDTINESEIKHRTELLDKVNDLSTKISEMLIALLK